MNDDTRVEIIEYAAKLSGDPLQNCYKRELINMACGRYDLGLKHRRPHNWWLPYYITGSVMLGMVLYLWLYLPRGP